MVLAYGLSLEQMAWRRNKIAELKDPLLFKLEYPATAAEAFQMSGHAYVTVAGRVPAPGYAHREQTALLAALTANQEDLMEKPKSEDEVSAIDLEQELGAQPAEPVETDSNDEPAADASGDSDDEREDENQAVPDPI